MPSDSSRDSDNESESDRESSISVDLEAIKETVCCSLLGGGEPDTTTLSLARCVALLREFLKHPQAKIAQRQVLRLLDALREIFSNDHDEEDYDACLDFFYDAAMFTDDDLASTVLSLMTSSPAMKRPGGIPFALFESLSYRLFASDAFHYEDVVRPAYPLKSYLSLSPALRNHVDGFLCSAVANFFVYEVGRRPQECEDMRWAIGTHMRNSPEGHEVNNFLTSPSRKVFMSNAWTSKQRSHVIDGLRKVDGDPNLQWTEIRAQDSEFMHLKIEKIDTVYLKVLNNWERRRQGYSGVLQKLLKSGYLQASTYDYLGSQRLDIMEKDLFAGPLQRQRYAIFGDERGDLPGMTFGEAVMQIEEQGGRVVGIHEIDGRDIIGVVGGNSIHNFETDDLRYWQIQTISEGELKALLCSVKAQKEAPNETSAFKRHLTRSKKRKLGQDKASPLHGEFNTADLPRSARRLEANVSSIGEELPRCFHRRTTLESRSISAKPEAQLTLVSPIYAEGCLSCRKRIRNGERV